MFHIIKWPLVSAEILAFLYGFHTDSIPIVMLSFMSILATRVWQDHVETEDEVIFVAKRSEFQNFREELEQAREKVLNLLEKEEKRFQKESIKIEKLNEKLDSFEIAFNDMVQGTELSFDFLEEWKKFRVI